MCNANFWLYTFLESVNAVRNASCIVSIRTFSQQGLEKVKHSENEKTNKEKKTVKNWGHIITYSVLVFININTAATAIKVPFENVYMGNDDKRRKCCFTLNLTRQMRLSKTPTIEF